MTNNMKLRRQVETNTRRMRQLMRDIRADVMRRTRNSKDIDGFLERMSPYINENVFVTGIHAASMNEIIKNIVKTANLNLTPRGANAELTKGILSDICFIYVSNVGKDIQTELQKIGVECYNNQLAPRETAKVIGERIDVFSTTRCQTIARTETIRASNLSNHVQARTDGAMSYTVHCNEGACEHCIAEYGENEDTVYDIDDTVNLPPFHPNCRCTPRYSTKTPEERGVEVEDVEETPTREPVEDKPIDDGNIYLNNHEDSFSDVAISEEAFQTILAHKDRRADAKIEWGNLVDLEDGTLTHAKDSRGKSSGVVVQRPPTDRDFGLLHNHPVNGGFSGADMYNQMTYRHQKVCIATTKDGVWIARDTEHATFSKNNYGINDSVASEIRSKMNAKSREISKDIYERKYKERMQNAKTRKEYNAIKKEYSNDPEYLGKYNEWLLEEFGVGKNRGNYFEIEFIPNERLKDVKF